jgi:hypothetical protein
MRTSFNTMTLLEAFTEDTCSQATLRGFLHAADRLLGQLRCELDDMSHRDHFLFLFDNFADQVEFLAVETQEDIEYGLAPSDAPDLLAKRAKELQGGFNILFQAYYREIYNPTSA